MVHRRIRNLQPLTRSLVLVAVTLQAIACGAGRSVVDAATRLGIDPAAIVDVGSAALAPAVNSDGKVSIVAIHQRDGEWVASPLTSSTGPRDADSLHLFSYDGATGEEWNTFVFGTAAPGTVRVELNGFPDQRGGTVVGGAWIIALRQKGLEPGAIEWRFIADDGTVRNGAGIFPPDA
jgi:hypothetical protein